jgi:hypothetical protein
LIISSATRDGELGGERRKLRARSWSACNRAFELVTLERERRG